VNCLQEKPVDEGVSKNDPAPATGQNPAPKPADAAAGQNQAAAPASGSSRRVPGKTGTASARRSGPLPGQPPPKPSHIKALIILLCVVLFLACLVMGGVVIYKRVIAPKAPVKHTKYSPEAQKLIDGATRAKQLYEDAAVKAKSDKLEDLQAAEKTMTDAFSTWTEISKLNQTVDEYDDLIQEAFRRLPLMDKDLRALRTRLTDAEMAQLREQAKKAAADKAPAPAPVAPNPPVAKVEDLSDANINRLIDDDPTEAERLIKLRQKQEPTYKPPREP
jgi:hypothetical protein